MSNAASRRRFLTGLAAVPIVGSGAAIAASAASPLEAEFLALAPTILSMLDRYDEIWATQEALFEAWEKASERLRWSRLGKGQGTEGLYEEAKLLPEWFAYIQARRPADEIDNALDPLLLKYMDAPSQSLEALALKHRIGKTLTQYEDDVARELENLLEARRREWV